MVQYKSLAFLGFPKYRVGTDGSYWSFRRSQWKRMFPKPEESGYVRVSPCNGRGIPTRFFLHQLVLFAFVGPCPPGMECRHKNGKKADNRRHNLAWGTPKENGEDKVRHGNSLKGDKNPFYGSTQLRGESNGFAKLTNEAIRKIRSLYGYYGKNGMTLKELAGMFGVSLGTVSSVARRKTWRHVT